MTATPLMLRETLGEILTRESCPHAELWLARDGSWYCKRCQPPAFESEIQGRRTLEEQLALDTGDPWARE